jgi:hypothetical protein
MVKIDESGYRTPIYKSEDVSNRNFGGVTVLARLEDKIFAKSKTSLWLVRCNSCQKTYELQSSHAVKNKYGCSECNYRNARSGSNHYKWTGGKTVPGLFLSQLLSKLNRGSRTLDCTITIHDLELQWEKQDGLCAYSGIQLQFGSNSTEQTASLDRIDSSKGYIKENIQFVHKDINLMKWNLTEERFLELIEKIYERKINGRNR